MQLAADRGTKNFAGSAGPPSFPTMTRLSSATSLAGLTALAFMSSSAMALTPMENWRQAYFGTTTNAGNASDNADPDHDGLPNLCEAMLGKNPTVADNVGVLTPQLTNSLPGMVYERVKSFTDVDLIPQVSGDLVHWRSGSSYLSTAVTQDLGTKERLRSSLLAQTSAPVFLRLMPARPSQSQLTATLTAQSNAVDTMLARCFLPSDPGGNDPFSGAMNIYPDNDAAAEPWLDWYFCNIGLCAFVSSHPTQVKAYMQRYLDYVDQLDATPGWNHRIRRMNLNSDKRTVKAGTLQDSDSDDAYASTFVRLACLYRKANVGDSWFATNLPKLKNLMYANVVTQVRANGLVRAKQQGYDIGFLEDNVENWAGLKELVDALIAVHDVQSEIDYYAAWRDAIRDAIQMQLWDEGHKRWKTHDAVLNAVPVFNEDIHCQVFPELYDLPHPSGAAETQRRYDAAWTYFNQQKPNWWTDVWAGVPLSHLDIAVVASKRGEKDHARNHLEVALSRWIPLGDDPRGTTISEIGYWKLLLTE